MSFIFTKLGSTLLVIALIAFGYFIYSAFGGTTVNVTLKTNPDLESGLVGHWTFDGKDMTNGVIDRSGNGNTGVLSGYSDTGTTTAVGKIGQSLEFDGANDYIDIGDLTSFFSSEATLNAWIKLDNNVPASTPQTGFFVLNSLDATDTHYPWTNGVIYLSIFRDDRIQVGDVGVDKSEWHMVTITNAPGANNWKFYQNGVEYFNATGEDTVFIDTVSEIGLNEQGDNFQGQIDDVRIYSRALSPEEISRLYELGGTTHVNVTLKTNPDLESGLVGHWTMDGKDMINNVADVSGQGNHGALQGHISTTTAIGVIGQALNFDGDDDYIDIGESAVLEPASVVSISTWFKRDGVQDTWVPLFQYGDVDTDPYGAYAFQFNNTADDDITFKISTSGASTEMTANTTINDGEWYHIAGTYDGSDMRVYINGAETNSTGKSGSLDGYGAIGLRIGTQVGSGRYFDGVIDDVRVYNRVLSAEEISRLYELGGTTHVNVTLKTNPDLESGLVGHWTFDGKDMISNVADVSGQGNTGYLNGTFATATSTAIGVLGQALEFNGSDDYVDTNFQPTDVGTMSAWMKFDTTGTTELTGIRSDGSARFYIGKNSSDAFSIGGGNGAQTYGTVAIDTWYHMVLVLNGAGVSGYDAFFYLDGVYKTGTNYTWTQGDISDLFIGAFSDPPDAKSFIDGQVDDVRVYNRALSAEEISRLYDMGR